MFISAMEVMESNIQPTTAERITLISLMRAGTPATLRREVNETNTKIAATLVCIKTTKGKRNEIYEIKHINWICSTPKVPTTGNGNLWHIQQ